MLININQLTVKHGANQSRIIRHLKVLPIFFNFLWSANASNALAMVASESKVYFKCQPGFQFESKAQSARCIRKQTATHKPPQPCDKSRGMSLKVDYRGLKDKCIAKASEENKLSSKKSKNESSPNCPRLFQINHRRGKDSCVQIKPESISPPNVKVTQ